MRQFEFAEEFLKVHKMFNRLIKFNNIKMANSALIYKYKQIQFHLDSRDLIIKFYIIYKKKLMLRAGHSLQK